MLSEEYENKTMQQTIERLIGPGSQGRNIDEQYSQKYLIESSSS